MINITYTGIVPYPLLEYSYVLLESKHNNVIEYCLSFQIIYILSFLKPTEKCVLTCRKVDPPPNRSDGCKISLLPLILILCLLS